MDNNNSNLKEDFNNLFRFTIDQIIEGDSYFFSGVVDLSNQESIDYFNKMQTKVKLSNPSLNVDNKYSKLFKEMPTGRNIDKLLILKPKPNNQK